jgi:hypothetical protein
MKPPPLPLFVETVSEQRFAEAILGSAGVQIISCWTSSGAISRAETRLLTQADAVVAVLVNTRTEDPIAIDESRQAAHRILGRAGPRENWYVAFAIPNLEAWARTDSRIRQDFETYQQGKSTYFDRAIRAVELTRQKPFDPTELLRQSPDFKGLIEFIYKHTAAPTGVKATAS